MFRIAKRRIPRALEGRQQRELEEFVGIYFPSGELRDAARKLWRALESYLNIDLSGLHPDDDLSAILSSEDPDSLELVVYVMVMEENLQVDLAGEGGRPGSFRSCVARIVHHQERRRR